MLYWISLKDFQPNKHKSYIIKYNNSFIELQAIELQAFSFTKRDGFRMKTFCLCYTIIFLSRFINVNLCLI